MLAICIASLGFTALFGPDAGIHLNEYIVEQQIGSSKSFHTSVNGKIIHKPTLRDSIAASNGDCSEEEWKQMPHIAQIIEYAESARPGFLAYWWPAKYVILHHMYLEWLHSIPEDSSLHLTGNYASVFVELHLKLFKNGLHPSS